MPKITCDRFVANKQLDFHDWLEARRKGITATQVAHASTPAGYKEAVADFLNPVEQMDNAFMAFGRDQEPVVALMLKDKFDIMPNEWVIAHEDDRRWLATPDGLSLDHTMISEIKTTGSDWEPNKIPIRYRRQVQWQLFVTGADACVFAWWLRVESANGFVPGWFEPKTVIMERDDKHIEKLVITAENLWSEVRGI